MFGNTTGKVCPRVEPGVTYRNIGIQLRIVSRVTLDTAGKIVNSRIVQARPELLIANSKFVIRI